MEPLDKIQHDVLSACLLSHDNYALAVDKGVTGAWFSRFGKLFEGLANEEPWNERTSVNQLSSLLKKHNAFELLENTPDWAWKIDEMETSIDVLASSYATRRINDVVSSALSMLSCGKDPYEIASQIRTAIDDVSHIEEAGGERTTSDIIEDALEIDRKVVSGGKVGLPFPWESFQRRTFGIPFRAVTPLGGRDGKGKSRLMTYLAMYWTSLGYPILYFPFEDGAERFMSNFSASLGEYDMFTAKREYVPSDFLPKHEQFMQRAKKLPIFVEDYPCTAERLESLIARYHRKHGIVGVVIDGMKDIVLSDGDSQTSREGHVVSVLNRAAKKYHPAIIAVSHLTDIEDDKWISKRNIRGNKVQSHSARMVLMYQDAGFPPFVISKYTCIGEGDVVLDAQKASYGEKGIVALKPELWRGRFEEILPNDRS